MNEWDVSYTNQQNFQAFSIKEPSTIDLYTDFFQPASNASHILSANLVNYIVKNVASFLQRLLTQRIAMNPMGTKVIQMKPMAVRWQRYLLTFYSFLLLCRSTQDLIMPIRKTMKPTSLNPIIMQAGIESYMWYLSCQPSLILLSIVIMMFTRPSIEARGTQRSKSRAFLKVTVQPQESNMIRTSTIESEVACRRRQKTSNTPCQTPLPQAQMRQPKYLKRMEATPIHRLILTVSLIQLSPSYYFSLYRYNNMPDPAKMSRGSSHPQ